MNRRNRRSGQYRYCGGTAMHQDCAIDRLEKNRAVVTLEEHDAVISRTTKIGGEVTLWDVLQFAVKGKRNIVENKERQKGSSRLLHYRHDVVVQATAISNLQQTLGDCRV